MLTQKDLEEIEKVVEEKLEEKLWLLPTKDEFFSKMDELMGELSAIRDEQTIIGHQVSDHEERLSVLEESHSGEIAPTA
jgi:predicted nuclease with TOPRIM domain